MKKFNKKIILNNLLKILYKKEKYFMDKDKIVKKWEPFLNNIGLTGSQLNNLSQLTENQSNEILKESGQTEFPSILPIAIRVAAKTMSQELIFASEEEINEVKNKVISENRDGKIDSVIDDKEFTEKKLEDDEDYKKLMRKGVTPMSMPSPHLMYLDFQYDSALPKGTDPSISKRKKK